jgi:hypothetical protein
VLGVEPSRYSLAMNHDLFLVLAGGIGGLLVLGAVVTCVWQTYRRHRAKTQDLKKQLELRHRVYYRV